MTVSQDEQNSRHVIFESDRLKVIRQDYGTPVVFVTFNELGLLKHGTFFWGFELFAKERVSSFGIVTAEPNWYPPDEMTLAIAAIRRCTRDCRVITYGHSQGGYGALKFAAALGATTSIAFCPQWSIAPASIGDFDQRYVNFHSDEWSNGLPIKRTDLVDNNYVFYDPRDKIDLRHVEIINSLRPIERIIVPLSGHETVRLIAEGGISSEFIQIFSKNIAPTASELRILLRKARGRSKTYKLNLLAALLRQAHLRQRCLQSLETAAGSDAAGVALCRALERGSIPEATSLLRKCSDKDLLDIGAVNVWTLFRKTKFAEGESRLAETILKKFPRDGFLRLHAVNSYIELGRYTEANRELLKIIAEVDINAHMAHVRSFAKLIGSALV